jgi:hypothetical protein
MNTFPQIADPTIDELRDAGLTKALIDGLAPMRADAAAFAAGVRARIEAPRAERPVAPPPWLCAAASVLPPIALPKSLPPAVGTAIAAKSSSKLAPALLLVPTAMMVAMTLTLLAVVRHFGAPPATQKQRVDRELFQEELQRWWREMFAWNLAYALFFAAGCFLLPVAALTLSFVAAAVGLSLRYDRFAQLSLASADEIARHARSAITKTFYAAAAAPCLLETHDVLIGYMGGVQHGVMLLAPLMAAAALWCHRAIRRKEPRDRMFWAAMGLACVFYGVTFAALRSRPAVPESMAGFAEIAPAPADRNRLEAVLVVEAAARRGGLPTLKQDELARCAGTLTADSPAGARLAAMQLGIVDAATREAWRESGDWERYSIGSFGRAPERGRHPDLQVQLLLRADELRADAALRDAYAGVIANAHAQPHRFDHLVQLLQAATTLDLLGADLAPLRARVHEALTACAVHDGFVARTRFSGYRPDHDARNSGALYPEAIPSAAAAVLMGMFGVPDGVDLREVELGLMSYMKPHYEGRRFEALAAFAGRAALATVPGYVDAEHGAVAQAARWQWLASALVLALAALAVTTRARRNT